MAFEIDVTASARVELKNLAAFDKRQLVDAIDTQLQHTPLKPTRNRKPLKAEVAADFEFTPPLWELRVGE